MPPSGSPSARGSSASWSWPCRSSLQRRLTLTRAALPLVVIAGIGEMLGSTLSAWGRTDSIAIAAVLGSQFAAIAAVVAFFLFGERLSRSRSSASCSSSSA